MKYAIYQHPVTRKFALIPVPLRFTEGDKLLRIPQNVRWLNTRDDAIAALSGLLDVDDSADWYA